MALDPNPIGDDAAVRDAALGTTDWRRLPSGTRRVENAAATGTLAGILLDPALTSETVSGTGADPERIVLVPGITGSKEDFVLMLPLLAAAGLRVESFDLAGQYESWEAGSDRARLELDDFVDDLIAVLETGEPAHVVGYSFGGILAQVVLERRPELIKSLVLLSTPPDHGRAFRGVKWLGPLSWLSPASTQAGLMIWGVSANMNGVDEARLEFARSRFASTRRTTVTDAMRIMSAVPDCTQAVTAAGIRCLVAVGSSDLWSVRRHRRFAKAIGAPLVIYPTGHSPCETTPHQFTRDVLAVCVAGRVDSDALP